jgi:hypothetical protein
MTVNTDGCLTCVDGYYIATFNPAGTTCSTCDPKCSRCKSWTNCKACNPTWYLVGNTCTPCVYPCATCLSATYCWTCGYDATVRNIPPECSCLHHLSEAS